MEDKEKKLGAWKTRCLDLEKKTKNKGKKLKKGIDDLKKAIDDDREPQERLEAYLVGLQKYIITEHTNDFNKDLR